MTVKEIPYPGKDAKDKVAFRCRDTETAPGLGTLVCGRARDHGNSSFETAEGTSVGYRHLAIRLDHGKYRFFTW